MPSVQALREALGAASSSDGGATARVARVLESIGWRGGDSASPEEVATEVLPSIASCVREHGDRGVMYREIAEVLRGSGPMMDGGLPPVSDYIPAAAEIVRRFAAPSDR